MSQYNLNYTGIKEKFGEKYQSAKDTVTGNFESEKRFPFVFELQAEFFTQAEAIEYLQTITSNENIDSSVPYENSKNIENKRKAFIQSSVYSRYADLGDSLTPLDANGNMRVPAASLNDRSASERGEILGLDSIVTRPNQDSTELGNNDAINCYWQFGWDDDLVHPLLSANRFRIDPAIGGLGRVYSETYNANQQILYITVGVPKFSRLISFYSNLFSHELSAMNIDGDTFPQQLGRLMGSGVSLAISAFTLPFRWFASIEGFVNNDQITRYVDFHETMLLYYRYVNGILIELAVNMGLMPKVFKSDGEGQKGTDGTQANISWEKLIPEMEESEAKSSHMFDIFKGGFNIFRILARRDLRARGVEDVNSGYYIEDEIEARKNTHTGDTSNTDDPQQNKIASKWFGWIEDIWNAYTARTVASWQGADKYIGFKVEKSTDASESLTNSTQESQLANYINSTSQGASQGKFMLGGGGWSQLKGEINNLPLGSVITSFIDGAVSAFQSASQSITGPLEVLTGDARVDIPEVWSSSSFTKSYNFNMILRSPYGDPYSIFINIYVPLIMILCMALPRAQGSNSYTQPFVLRAFCKGMFSVPYGIIESISIKRGASEFGWAKSRLPTVVEVSIGIKDLTPNMIMSMDLGDSPLAPLNLVRNIFGENTSFQEYLQTLSGMGLVERLLWSERFRRRLTSTYLKLKSKFTPEYLGFMTADSTVGRMIGAISPNSRLPTN